MTRPDDQRSIGEFREIMRLAARLGPSRENLARLRSMLPETSAGVASLIELVIERQDADGLLPILHAAASRGDEIAAHHLVKGLHLVVDPLAVPYIVRLVQGDVAGALLQAVREDPRVPRSIKAMALLAAVTWLDNKADERPREPYITEARILARRRDPFTVPPLLLLGERLHDEQFDEVLASLDNDDTVAMAEILDERIRLVDEGTIEDWMPEQRPAALSGMTVRRAIPKLGRNDPCHCGSGRKYKKCCAEKDKERLADSSAIAGVTRTELREHPETHLTSERIDRTHHTVLARLDFDQVEQELLLQILQRLNLAGQYESIERFFQDDVRLERYHDHLQDAIDFALMDRQPEIARRLYDLAGDRLTLDDFEVTNRLLLRDERPGPLLQAMEELALKCIDGNPADLAHAFLGSQTPGLGILVARGVLLNDDFLFDADVLLEALLVTRDRIGLPARDPVESKIRDLLDEAFTLPEEPRRETRQSQPVREELVAATTRAAELQDELEVLRRELVAKETEVAATTDRQLPADAEDGPPPETLVAELSRLRRRLSLLNEEYQERHDERNQLRREIKSLRQQESQSPETSRQRGEQPPEPAEEEGLPLESVEGIEPRLPSFGPDFVSSLAHIPRQVRAAALKLIGRLAAGERSAYAGCVKLKRVSGILRARVGRDYRLLFRLESSALKVVDIVHRQGLEQRINRLADSVLRKN